jgi:hypothetical protein
MTHPRPGATLMPMTWKTLTDLLSAEFRKIRKAPVVSFGFTNAPVADPEELRAEELRCAPRLDAIIHDFARTRRWPALDEKDRYFLRERIRFAYEYAMIASMTVPRPARIAGREHIWSEQRRLVEWLLIDVWRDSGVINWLEPLLLIHESTPRQGSSIHLAISE